MTTKFQSAHPLVVTSVERATALLCSTNTKDEIQHVVSIADPFNGKRPPAFSLMSKRCLLLTFDDVESNYVPIGGIPQEVAPTIDDVHALLEWGSRLSLQNSQQGMRRGRVLVHCFAGVSRSTACAFALAAQSFGPDKEGEAFEFMLAGCEKATGRVVPNELVVEHADALLGRKGAMSKIVRKHNTGG